MAEHPVPHPVPHGGSTLGVHAAVFAAMFLISFSYPVGEAIANELDTGVLLFLRFALATAIFGPLVAWRHGLTWPGWRALGGYAAISTSLVVFFWCLFYGLRTTSALNTGAISTLIPGLTAIGGAILVGERLGWHRLAALGIGLVGALWVVFRGDWERFVRLDLNSGDLIVFAGCVVMGFYSPLVKRFHRGEPVIVMTFWVVAINALWCLVIANSAIWTMAWGDVPLFAYGGVACIALASTVVSFFLMQWSTIRLGPTRVQSYSYLLPAFVLVIDWAIGKGPADGSHRSRHSDRPRREPGDPAGRDLRGPLGGGRRLPAPPVTRETAQPRSILTRPLSRALS